MAATAARMAELRKMKKKNSGRDPYKQSLTDVSEERIEQVRDLRERGLSRTAIAYKLKMNWSTICNVFNELDRRSGENKVYDMVRDLMNNDFTSVKKIAAENIVRLLQEGNTSISKWIMEKGFGTKVVSSEEDVFGNEKNA